MRGSGIEERSNSNAIPSKVVQLRNVPQDVYEADLMNWALPFGKVVNLLFQRRKNRAMVEFADLSSGISMFTYWQQRIQPTFGGKNIYCVFSKHQQINQIDNNSKMNGSFGHNCQGNHSEFSTTETPVLRVVVEQLVFSVNVDHFYQLFSEYGKVSKVVTFMRKSSFQAFIQFEQIGKASAARQGMDGTPMFGPSISSMNILRVGFSKLTNLKVKFNNEKSRDYTNPSLPSGLFPSGHFGLNAGRDTALSHVLAMPDHVTLEDNIFGCPWMSTPEFFHDTVFEATHGCDVIVQNAFGKVFGCVLLACNLPEQMTNPDALFTLFGVYGDVLRVRVLFKRKGNAMIQMSNSQQAQVATQHLDRLKIMGQTLKVNPSIQEAIHLPNKGKLVTGLTKDFANSELHRFKKPRSKNYKICPPSTTLYLSNILCRISEKTLLEVIRREVRPEAVTAFKFFPNDRRMALISFATLDDSVMALIKLHNYQLTSTNLKISFSKPCSFLKE